MNNIDGSYYAAVQIGNLQSQKRKEQEQKELEQKRYKEEKRRSWIQFWIPLIISLIALLRPEIIKFINYVSNLISKL